MAGGPYFWFNDDDDNKIKYMYTHNHQKGKGELNADSPIYCMEDNSDNWPNLKQTLNRM